MRLKPGNQVRFKDTDISDMSEIEMTLIRYATIEDAAAIARVHTESWRSAYRGIVPDHYLDSIDVEEWAERHRRNMAESSDGLVAHVAEVQSEVVGWAVGGPNHETESAYSGELYTIYLLPEYQRLGIGLKLVVATVDWLVESGFNSIMVWVLAENRPARRFYEALGGEYIQEKQITIGGVALPEVAYGWKDLASLVTKKD